MGALGNRQGVPRGFKCTDGGKGPPRDFGSTYGASGKGNGEGAIFTQIQLYPPGVEILGLIFIAP